MRIGLYNPYLGTKGGGEKVCLAIAEDLSKDHDVHLLSHEKADLNEFEKYFNLDLSRVKLDVVKHNGLSLKLVNKLPIPRSLKNFWSERNLFMQLKRHNYDVFVNNCYQSGLPNPAKKGIYMCMFPQKLKKQHTSNLVKIAYRMILDSLYKVFLYSGKQNSIQTYDLITANSKYTQGYVKKFWKMDSEIIYPICDSMLNSSIPKEKIILNVGRFFENLGENHHKKQDFLLDQFAKMKSLHAEGWELHFAGSVAEDAGGLRYILKLMKAAEGLPIQFHFNCAFKELKTLYNQASIYWHATGYGSDPAKHPEKQEHFGIATVEAMSTGALPVVINSAGQKESVEENISGFLWHTGSELKEKTLDAVIISRQKTQLMSTEAINNSMKFNKESFDKSLRDIFGF